MRDEPGTGSGNGSGDGAEDDGLDAWLAANFPPKPPEEPVAPTEPPPPAGPVPPAAPPAPAEPPPAQSVPPAPIEPSVPPFPPVPSTPHVAPEPPAEPFPPAPPAPTLATPVSPTSGFPLFPPMSEELGGVPPAPEFPPAPTEAFSEVGGASGIDSLFGESKFRDYENEPDPTGNPFTAASPGGRGSGGAGAGISTTQKTLMWIAGSLVALLALLALFTLGTKLPALLGPAPDTVAAPTDVSTPTPTEAPLGPVAPGDYRWDQLLGGECVNPYPGPWAQKYTVVDCDTPHPAQLVVRGTFSSDDGFATPYPGIEALQAQVNLLCTAPTVVDYSKATAYTDIQFEASFAATVDDWVSGDRNYYCFLSRSSGGMLTESVAKPQVAPTPTPEPTATPTP